MVYSYTPARVGLLYLYQWDGDEPLQERGEEGQIVPMHMCNLHAVAEFEMQIFVIEMQYNVSCGVCLCRCQR